jgi:fructosamine-3-kinase
VIDLAGARQVGGGDVNDGYDVTLPGGPRVFVKTRAGAAPGEYATEAAGLRWLAEAGARTPEVVKASDAQLVLEWIEEGGARDDEELGRMLAGMHLAGAPSFGALPPGAPGPLRIGPLELGGEPVDEWPRWYAERMLAPLLPRAGLSAAGARAVESVCERMADLAGPPGPPARLHGDLWSGNVLSDAAGRAWLIDPAAHGGHREVDLAMLRLFGAPSPRLLAAYEEVAPLATGHEDRVALYQLLPLMVHAVLFGGGYAASAERAARHYAG